MVLDYMICMVTRGNGLLIGMDVRIRTVVRGVIRVLAVCIVVVAGAAPRPARPRPPFAAAVPHLAP